MKKENRSTLVIAAALALVAGLITACALNPVTKTTTVDAVTGKTNVTFSVNSVVLDGECQALGWVGTPLLSQELKANAAARPIVIDIQTALQGAINGADTNIQATIQGLLSQNASVQKQFTPLIQGADNFRAALILKYGSTVAGEITLALLREDLAIVTAALNATQ